MKFSMASLILLLSACAPAAYKNYHKATNQYHPPLVHAMEQLLAEHNNNENAEIAAWAKDFWTGFEKEFDAYKPAKNVVYELFEVVQKDHVKIKIIGGNWCSDTRTQIPRLIKVLHQAGLSPANHEYIQVDRNKNSIPAQANWTAPTKVPTVMVYNNNKLLGSIIETPSKTWEKDLMSLLKK
jgi:hypothetical protein